MKILNRLCRSLSLHWNKIQTAACVDVFLQIFYKISIDLKLG